MDVPPSAIAALKFSRDAKVESLEALESGAVRVIQREPWEPSRPLDVLAGGVFEGEGSVHPVYLALINEFRERNQFRIGLLSGAIAVHGEAIPPSLTVTGIWDHMQLLADAIKTFPKNEAGPSV